MACDLFAFSLQFILDDIVRPGGDQALNFVIHDQTPTRAHRHGAGVGRIGNAVAIGAVLVAKHAIGHVPVHKVRVGRAHDRHRTHASIGVRQYHPVAVEVQLRRGGVSGGVSHVGLDGLRPGSAPVARLRFPIAAARRFALVTMHANDAPRLDLQHCPLVQFFARRVGDQKVLPGRSVVAGDRSDPLMSLLAEHGTVDWRENLAVGHGDDGGPGAGVLVRRGRRLAPCPAAIRRSRHPRL